MTLNALLDIELAVQNPEELMQFWQRHGMRRTADNVLGTIDRPTQMTLREAPYRHLATMHLGCTEEKDLADIATRLREAGIDADVSGTTLTCVDPVFKHRVVIDVTTSHPLAPSQARSFNTPGRYTRFDTRANPVLHREPPAPRRVGHVVLGTPHMGKAVDFYVNLLGYRVSDSILNGFATFMRIESDHHNLMIQPGPTSYLNHYAVEVDDIDAVGLAGQAVVAEREDASVVGVGRHNLGANVFWYLRDPSGNMFEFFSDMDQILDDEDWNANHRKLDWEGADGPAGFSVWGPKDPPEIFFNPPDINAIAAGRAADGLD
jgi:catechol 2,3-dioxygenase-like lactoylglutathione lyase family enzyme